VLLLEMEARGFDAYCPSVPSLSLSPQTMSFLTMSAEILDAQAAVSNSTQVVTVQHFQIFLWTSILLVVVLLWALCAMCNMTIKKDPLIYSTFNPKWEDRKRT